VKRIQSFLESVEVPPAPFSAPTQPDVVLQVEATSFRWRTADDVAIGAKSKARAEKKKPEVIPPVLTNLSFSAGRGSLVMVGGAVGSGKTAVLESILGELDLVGDGTLRRRGSIAFVAQNPWIMAGSVRSNILFGLPLDEVWYWRVVHACALDTDLRQLADADNTEIGERGVNLSGGQKARVALARAVYAKADLVLLDDPLSAVDPAVAQHIMANVVLGLLKDSAVVLVTHHLHFFTHATDILLVMPGGAVERCQSLEAVEQLWPEVARGEADVAQTQDAVTIGPEQPAVIAEAGFTLPATKVSGMPSKEDICQPVLKAIDNGAIAMEATTAKEDAMQKFIATDTKKSGKQPGRVIVLPEDRKMGQVSLSTYVDYARHGGFARYGAVAVLFLGGQACLVSTDFWLQNWAQKSASVQQDPVYLNGYVSPSSGKQEMWHTFGTLFRKLRAY